MAKQDEMGQVGLGLAEVLKALSNDLKTAAMNAATNGAFGLAVAEAEVSLAVTVAKEKTTEGSAGIKWYVLSLGGKRASAATDSSVHTIKLKLTPADQTSPIALAPDDTLEGASDGASNTDTKRKVTTTTTRSRTVVARKPDQPTTPRTRPKVAAPGGARTPSAAKKKAATSTKTTPRTATSKRAAKTTTSAKKTTRTKSAD